MRFDIIFAPDAVMDFGNLRAMDRAKVRDALEAHLRHDPTKVSRSRIKRLRGVSKPQYRMRVDDLRVFYDIVDHRVEVLAIVAKAEASSWLAKFENPG